MKFAMIFMITSLFLWPKLNPKKCIPLLNPHVWIVKYPHFGWLKSTFKDDVPMEITLDDFPKMNIYSSIDGEVPTTIPFYR